MRRQLADKRVVCMRQKGLAKAWIVKHTTSMPWLYPRRMRRRIHSFTVSWTNHRLVLRAYGRNTGGFHDETHFHEGMPNPEARVAVLAAGVDQVESLMSHCTMSFEAMPNLLTRRQLPWPFLAMSRICLEAAARLCYTLALDIDPDRRLMRFGALTAWSNYEASKALAAVGSLSASTRDEALAALEAMAGRLDEHMSAAGFCVDHSGRYPVVRDPSGRYPPEPSDLNLVDTLERQFPGIGEDYFRRLSGFVHGAPWILAEARTFIDSQTFVPEITAHQIIDAFLLVSVAVNNAMNLSAMYSGIPFGFVQRHSKKVLDLTQAEAERLKRRKRRQPAMRLDRFRLTAPWRRTGDPLRPNDSPPGESDLGEGVRPRTRLPSDQ